MFGEGSAVDEALPTVPTFIWLHSRVDHLVANKLCTLAKGLPTPVTLKGLRPGVNPLMLGQVFAAAKCFLTFLTLKVLFTSP